MEWFDWALTWEAVKDAFNIIAYVWSVFVVLTFFFWAVTMWRMIPRLDSLLVVESILSKREGKAKELAEETQPRTYSENIADHERAMKRLSEGLDQ